VAKYDIADRLLGFAARAGKVCDSLPRTRMGNHVAGQLVRCSSSPGSNYEEGCGAESRADFVHKLSVALKETRESCFWLRLIVKAELLPQKRMASILDEGQQLSAILAKSIVTAKANEGCK